MRPRASLIALCSRFLCEQQDDVKLENFFLRIALIHATGPEGPELED
jgi:hypothetical protein